MEGYRLVSASIFVRYVGPKIQQGGYIISIPTYKNFPAFATTSVEPKTYVIPKNNTGDLPSYNPTVMNTTRGTHTSYLTSTNYTRRLYVPLDSFDCAFEDPGYFYSPTLGSQQSQHEFQSWNDWIAAGEGYQEVNGSAKIRKLIASEGNPLRYVFYGSGIQDQSDCIIITAFYNFECIPAEGVIVPNSNKNEFEFDAKIKEKIFDQVKIEAIENPNVNKEKIVKEVLKEFN
jgi:hypothetical protein